jgi:hypothetical protein
MQNLWRLIGRSYHFQLQHQNKQGKPKEEQLENVLVMNKAASQKIGARPFHLSCSRCLQKAA